MCALQIAMNDDHCRKFLARSSDSQAQQTHPLRNRERVAQPTILQKRNPFPIGRHQIESGWKERKKESDILTKKKRTKFKPKQKEKSHTDTPRGGGNHTTNQYNHHAIKTEKQTNKKH